MFVETLVWSPRTHTRTSRIHWQIVCCITGVLHVRIGDSIVLFCAPHSYANTDLALLADLAHLYANILFSAGTVFPHCFAASLLNCCKIFTTTTAFLYCYNRWALDCGNLFALWIDEADSSVYGAQSTITLVVEIRDTQSHHQHHICNWQHAACKCIYCSDYIRKVSKCEVTSDFW